MRAQLLGQWEIIYRCIEKSHDPLVRSRLAALAAMACGFCVSDVARWFSVTRQTLYNWGDRFLQSQFRPESLANDSRPGRPTHWDAELTSFLAATMQYSPRRFGYPNANWTIELLQDHLVNNAGQWFSDDTIRRQLHQLGYVWKRARYVLAPDPEREKKKKYQETAVAIA